MSSQLPMAPERTPDRPGPGPIPPQVLRSLDLAVLRRVESLVPGEYLTPQVGGGTDRAYGSVHPMKHALLAPWCAARTRRSASASWVASGSAPVKSGPESSAPLSRRAALDWHSASG